MRKTGQGGWPCLADPCRLQGRVCSQAIQLRTRQPTTPRIAPVMYDVPRPDCFTCSRSQEGLPRRVQRVLGHQLHKQRGVDVLQRLRQAAHAGVCSQHKLQQGARAGKGS